MKKENENKKNEKAWVFQVTSLPHPLYLFLASVVSMYLLFYVMDWHTEFIILSGNIFFDGVVDLTYKLIFFHLSFHWLV